MLNISVVISLFNKEETIERAINSVLDQTSPAYEIIIVNDGSTDNSLDKIKNFCDPRIITINQINGGVSKARNTGINAARGEFISFLDADDEWCPSYLSSICDLIITYPDAVGFGTSYYKKYCNNVQIESKVTNIPFKEKTGLLTNYFEVCIHSDPPIWTGAVCIKKELMLFIGGFPEGVKAGEDLLTWARLSQLGFFAYSKDCLAIYYQPSFNSSFQLPPHIDYVGDQLKKLLGTKNPNSQKNHLRVYIGRWYKMRAALFLINGKEKRALLEIIHSLRFSGLSIKLLFYILLILFPVKTRFHVLFSRQTI